MRSSLHRRLKRMETQAGAGRRMVPVSDEVAAVRARDAARAAGEDVLIIITGVPRGPTVPPEQAS